MTPLSNKELEEIRERLGRVSGRCDLSATPALMSPDNLPQNPRVWYDDGDLCAEVWENLGLDIDGDAIAEIFAHAIADGKRLLETIEHLQKYQQHREYCAKWGWVWHIESGVVGYELRDELRDYDERGNKIACTCGLVEEEG